MSTNHTENYGLCQWEADDQVLRTDFNEDNAKLDAALAGLPRVICGSYVGDGAESRIIPLSATPKAVFLSRSNTPLTMSTGSTSDNTYVLCCYGGFALSGSPQSISDVLIFQIVENGIQVYFRSAYDGIFCSHTNQKNITYHYLALL